MEKKSIFEMRGAMLCVMWMIVLVVVVVRGTNLKPTNDYDNDGLCVWACSGHGDCYTDEGKNLPSCHCEVTIFFSIENPDEKLLFFLEYASLSLSTYYTT